MVVWLSYLYPISAIALSFPLLATGQINLTSAGTHSDKHAQHKNPRKKCGLHVERFIDKHSKN
jgi:hypothetical protein